MAHRTIGGRPLTYVAALEGIARDLHRLVVVQKPAQVGMTELAIGLSLHAADTAFAERGHVGFFMPTDNQMGDFAQTRFDRAIQDNAYLRSRLQPEPPRRKGADNKRVKHFGPGVIYMRGADPNQLTSIDLDFMTLDEFDQMPEETRVRAEKRLLSSHAGRLLIMSTPRIPEAGINGLILRSDQRRYHLTCPACGLAQPTEWPDNVDFEHARVVCRECRSPMDGLAKGRWVAGAPGNDAIHGYILSPLNSPWVKIATLIEASQATSPWEQIEFYNSNLGQPFYPASGGGLTFAELDTCRAPYSLGRYAGQQTVMGVDPGVDHHWFVIREAPPRPTAINDYGAKPTPGSANRLWFAGEISSLNEIDALAERFNCQAIVIDLYPQTEAVTEFARRSRRSIWLADYNRYEPGYEFKPGGPLRRIGANRTDMLDQVVSLFRRQELLLPAGEEARHLGGKVRDGVGEYYRQVTAAKKTYERGGRDGNPQAHWTEGSKADHLLHCEVYVQLGRTAIERTRVIFYQ
jgi:phage terminase large subunit GpA